MEPLALVFAAVLTGLALYLVPSWRGEFLEPFHAAFLGAGVMIVLLYFTRRFRLREVERKALALFVMVLPVIYMTRANGEWLWIEGAGMVVFGACAVLGLLRSPWFLVAGIVGHGLVWDAWHYLTMAPTVPSWYGIGCLLIDVGIGAYAGVRTHRTVSGPA